MKVLNSKGEQILLNAKEAKLADVNQRFVNSLGYEIPITTLTTIMKKISEQKFFEIAPADYMPVKVGEGSWSTHLTTYRSFNLADDFETGIINLGSGNSRMGMADSAVDSVSIKVNNWGKQIEWNLMELETAAKAGNWDLVTAKERSRKKNFDLGIQKVAFLGMENDPSCRGLLNQSGITSDDLITKNISSMDADELKVFCAGVLDVYRKNCNRTAWPTHFIIPESDFLGLASPASSSFPIRSTLDLLLETFKVMTKNANFQILPCSYCDKTYSGLGVQRYVLLNYEEESLNMSIPVPYTSTVANSINNFSFQNVAYSQFTGVNVLRPLELLYLDF